MSQWWAVVMLLSGGLFAGSVVSIAWERVPAWRQHSLPEFRTAFAHTLRRVDRLQPALLAISLASTIGFAATVDGGARALAMLAAGGFLLVLVGSAAWLVPLQRRMVDSSAATTQDLEGLRTQWLRGHVIRTIVGVTALTLVTVAVTV